MNPMRIIALTECARAVFEDDVLAGAVFADQRPVSRAEELLRALPEAWPGLVDQAVAQRLGQVQARRAVL
jgi:hypothetical protein